MDLNSVLMLVPVVSYIALVFSVKTGRLAGIYLFLTVTLATTILGIISISLIEPLNLSPSGLKEWVQNLILAVYVGAMIYGGIGARTGSAERLLVGGFAVVLVSLVSAVI